jgi:predicted secreted protein
MPSNAVSSVGLAFKRSDMASSPAFTAIAEINDLSGPNKSRETIDVTSLDSTGGYREFIASFRDAGEVTLNMNFTRDGYVDMDADFASSSSVDYQIVLPDTGNTTFDFAAYVTALGMAASTGDKVTASVTLKITGVVTLTS